MRATLALFPVLALILLGLNAALPWAAPRRDLASGTPCELVVLAHLEDPYFPLAEEIASAENSPVAHTISAALACHPVFLVWVASPAALTDAALVESGLALKGLSTPVSSGIITGSTLEKARALWKRRVQAGGQAVYAANAPNPAAHIEAGQIVEASAGEWIEQPLTKAAFLQALQTASYLTFTGHGGSGYLKLDEETQVSARDIPALPPVVVETGSCQTVRPWKEGSIALRLVDQGAAAYAGFVFSPNEGFLIGEFDGLPFRYTWPGFPIGHVLQAQNRGALQGFAHFPYLVLLGDPRLALQTAPPYTLVEDSQAGGRRVLRYQGLPAGVVPIRIPGGAGYRYVKAQGITSASQADPFYNSKLQMVDIAGDKYLLLDQPGGELALELRPGAPWSWVLGDLLFDSLDDTLIFSQQTGGDGVALGFAVLPLAWTARQLAKRRLAGRKLRLALALATAATGLQAAYVLLRLDRVTITSKEVAFSPLSLAASFLLYLCGTLIYFQARSWVGKAAAFSVIAFNGWTLAAFTLALLGAYNQFFFQPAIGTSLYSYSISWLPSGTLLLTLALAGLALPAARRLAVPDAGARIPLGGPETGSGSP